MTQTTGANGMPADTSKLGGVPETLLIPLWFRAREMRSKHPLVRDPYAVGIVERLDRDLSHLARDRMSHTGVLVRTLLMDRIVVDYTDSVPDPIVVNLGAGLDARHLRFPKAKWFSIDLPESMEVRDALLPGGDVRIVGSAFDLSWIDSLPRRKNILFLSEGVLMYFPPEQVRGLFRGLADSFGKSLLTFDTVAPFAVGRGHRSVDTTKAPFRWGNRNLSDIEAWHPRLKALRAFPLADVARRRWKLYWALSRLIPPLRHGFKVALVGL